MGKMGSEALSTDYWDSQTAWVVGPMSVQADEGTQLIRTALFMHASSVTVT